MKAFTILIFLLLFFHTLMSYGQTSLSVNYSTSIEAIYSNINIINNSIQSLRRKTKSLKWRLNKEIQLQKKINKNNINGINYNANKIKDIQEQFYSINVDYKSVLKQIEVFELAMDSLNLKLNNQVLLSTKLNENLDLLTKDYLQLKNKFAKIPDIILCENCYPKFNFSFSTNRYITFNADDVTATQSFTLELMYNANRNISWWFNYMSPFLVTITTLIKDSLQISDKWNTEIISLGFLYKPKNLNSKISYSFGSGLFWGSSRWDKFLNSTIGFTRSTLKNVFTYGINARAELNYNEFSNKNPLELFLGINTLISYNKIVLDPGINSPHDLGRILVYFSLGIRFNFWNK